MESLSSTTTSSTLSCKIKLAKGTVRIAKPVCHNDNDAIAALPDDWIPQRSGPIIANYLKKREQDHRNIHEEIVKCAAEANHDIDERIRKLAELFLAHIERNQLDIECVVKNCSKKNKLTETDQADAFESINKLSLQRIGDMASFNRDASAIEKERAEKLKNIMRDKFQRLVAVGHMTPKDLLHNFDQRIYEINQQLLSNSRAFIELESKLRVQLDESVVNARNSLNQLKLGVGVTYRRRDSVSVVRHASERKLALKRSMSADRSLDGVILSDSFLGDVEELEACVSRVVHAYRSAVLKVYTGFCVKLDDLEYDLYGYQVMNDLNHIHLCEFSDFQKLIERPLRRLTALKNIKATNKTLVEITGADMLSMQKSLYSLGECLQNTYAILHKAGHLWDAHVIRAALAQKLTMTAVEDLVTSHDAIELTTEINVSIAIEQLRRSPDADKLQQQLDFITKMLDKTAEMYYHHSEEEIGRLEEFLNFPTGLANTLLSEFDVFLEQYRRVVKVIEVGTNPLTPVVSSSQKPNDLRLPLPRAIFQTELQELALKNWKDGFLESFANNISLVPEELKRQAQLWVDERSTALHMRYSLKMISHSIRMERVMAAKEMRLAELQHHVYRLESHLLAINNLVDSLTIEASKFAAMDAPFLYPMMDWIQRITNNIEEMNLKQTNVQAKSSIMASYSLRLPTYRQLFEESLDKAVADYKVHLDYRIQEARVANVRFMSQIKLFNEGGRYAVQEAIKACAALTKGSDALELCNVRAFEVLNQRRNQLLAYADSQLLPLIRVIDDEAKMTKRSVTKMEKKKKKVVI